MCSILFDSLWIKLGQGVEKNYNVFFLFSKILLIYDVVSDFMFWNSIKEDPRVSIYLIWSVFFFACVGILVDCIGSCKAFAYSSPDSWGKDRAVASQNYQIRIHKLSIYISFAEDIPQIILAVWVAFQQGLITNFFLLTTFGSGLNILRNIISNHLYLKYEKEARSIIRNEKKESVKYYFCKFKVFEFFPVRPELRHAPDETKFEGEVVKNIC
jgi:hypothetical protein